ncbi:MAG: ribonuclease Z [Bacteroidota bacterium]
MLRVQILGTTAAVPAHSRLPSAQVVSFRDRYYLIDCGEATQLQMLRYRIRYSRLDAIFISHMHLDHILGLPGLLATMSLYGRNFPLKLYGPAALKGVLDMLLEESGSFLTYELEFIPTNDFEPGSELFSTPYLSVKALPLDHRIFCRGFLFQEVNKRPRFNFYHAKSLEIPNQFFGLLKQGNAVELPDGRVIQPEEVLHPPEAPLSYAYCSDTRYHMPLTSHIEGSNLLYHESTFMKNLQEKANETYHSTTIDAARIAEKAGVQQLILGHYSARYRDLQPLLEEAREVFPNTDLALEGRIFNLQDYV